MKGTVRHDALTCPACGFAKLDASTALGDPGAPSPGDFTVCAECGAWLQFGEGLSLENAEEFPADMDEPLRAKVRAVQAFARARRERRAGR